MQRPYAAVRIRTAAIRARDGTHKSDSALNPRPGRRLSQRKRSKTGRPAGDPETHRTYGYAPSGGKPGQSRDSTRKGTDFGRKNCGQPQ